MNQKERTIFLFSNGSLPFLNNGTQLHRQEEEEVTYFIIWFVDDGGMKMDEEEMETKEVCWGNGEPEKSLSRYCNLFAHRFVEAFEVTRSGCSMSSFDETEEVGPDPTGKKMGSSQGVNSLRGDYNFLDLLLLFPIPAEQFDSFPQTDGVLTRRFWQRLIDVLGSLL